MTTPIQPPVSVGETVVGDLKCQTDAQGQTQCEVEGLSNEGTPCVDGKQAKWASPGDAVHGASAEISEVFTDGGQSWARLINGAVVPICAGTVPSSATYVGGPAQGVSVGQVNNMQNEQPPQPPQQPTQPPTQEPQAGAPPEVCPPGWSLMGDGTCIAPESIATPDPECPPGYYLKEFGECVPIDFDPPPAAVVQGVLVEMAPDMPPASTPHPDATFDPKSGKLQAPGTPFDGMDIQPYGHGVCDDNYNGGKRSVFFAMGVARMFATIVEDHGACCDACSVGGACAKAPKENPYEASVPRGSVRIRMGFPEPMHGDVTVRDQTTKVVTASRGYTFTLQPLAKPLDTFTDAYGRTVYAGKKMFTAPGFPAPVSPQQVPQQRMPNPGQQRTPNPGQQRTPNPGQPRRQNPAPRQVVNPGVIQQGPVMNPGGAGISQGIGERMAGLPPRNPEWSENGYPGPFHGVKF